MGSITCIKDLSNTLVATAFTSTSFHLLFARRNAAAERARFTARITILEDLVARLKSGERVPSAEIDRLLLLSRKAQDSNDEDYLGDTTGSSTPWKEVFLGRSSKE